MRTNATALANLTAAALCASVTAHAAWTRGDACTEFSAGQLRNDGTIGAALAAAAIDAYPDDDGRFERYNFLSRHRMIHAQRALARIERAARASGAAWGGR